jgi:hypothetical protein
MKHIEINVWHRGDLIVFCRAKLGPPQTKWDKVLKMARFWF